MFEADRDFSQYGEQQLILTYVRGHPDLPRFSVDAGAFDGVTGSNTRALFLLGWRGLLIEPDYRTFAHLKKLYADRPDVRCLRYALSDRPGFRRIQLCMGPAGTAPELTWHYAQVNTFHRPFAESYVANHDYEYTQAWVRVTTLTRALRHSGAPNEIGFISIDCEGEDLAVLNGLDFERYRPRLLCIECDDQSRPRFADYLRNRGYEYYANTAANTLFALNSYKTG